MKKYKDITACNQLSKKTQEKIQLAKNYIEDKYRKHFEQEQQKRQDYQMLIEKMSLLQLSEEQKKEVQQRVVEQEQEYLRNMRIKDQIQNYTPLAIIGRGAFGEVWLCWHKNGELVAIKKMSKIDMDKKNQQIHIRAERDILAQSDTKWIVELKSSFTDENNLYLVMEYLPGGDLMELLILNDTFKEEAAKFYLAELILAVESVHKLNFIHRDLKPDNILIDKQGHLKLADFGLCKPFKTGQGNIKEKMDFKQEQNQSQKIKTDSNKCSQRERAYSMVGTVDYIAPEVFDKEGYNETVDWWSLGAILYEMLYGGPPLTGRDTQETCLRVINFERELKYPDDTEGIPVSAEAKNLLQKLLVHQDQRLGKNGVEEIKKHPFFKNVDWNSIWNQKAPFVPELKSDTDTQNFQSFEEEVPWTQPLRQRSTMEEKNRRHKKDYFWIGYTYKKPDKKNMEDQIEKIFEQLQAKKIQENKKNYSQEKIPSIQSIEDDGVKNMQKKVRQNPVSGSAVNGQAQQQCGFLNKKQIYFQTMNPDIKSIQQVSSIKTSIKQKLSSVKQLQNIFKKKPLVSKTTIKAEKTLLKEKPKGLNLSSKLNESHKAETKESTKDKLKKQKQVKIKPASVAKNAVTQNTSLRRKESQATKPVQKLYFENMVFNKLNPQSEFMHQVRSQQKNFK